MAWLGLAYRASAQRAQHVVAEVVQRHEPRGQHVLREGGREREGEREREREREGGREGERERQSSETNFKQL
jgi:hypothetical protein